MGGRIPPGAAKRQGRAGVALCRETLPKAHLPPVLSRGSNGSSRAESRRATRSQRTELGTGREGKGKSNEGGRAEVEGWAQPWPCPADEDPASPREPPQRSRRAAEPARGLSGAAPPAPHVTDAERPSPGDRGRSQEQRVRPLLKNPPKTALLRLLSGQGAERGGPRPGSQSPRVPQGLSATRELNPSLLRFQDSPRSPPAPAPPPGVKGVPSRVLSPSRRCGSALRTGRETLAQQVTPERSPLRNPPKNSFPTCHLNIF